MIVSQVIPAKAPALCGGVYKCPSLIRKIFSQGHSATVPLIFNKMDIDTDEVYSYNPNNLNDALELLNKAEVLNLGNQSDILFRGIKTSAGNQTGNLKSLQGISTWVLDEAEELIDEDIFDTIDLSIREKDIQNRIILIF